MNTEVTYTPDPLPDRIHRLARRINFASSIFLCLLFLAGGYWLIRGSFSATNGITGWAWPLLFGLSLLVGAYDARPGKDILTGRRQFHFPLGNPHATMAGAIGSALFYASCAMMFFNMPAEESSWFWTSGLILNVGITLGYAVQVVWLLSKRHAMAAEAAAKPCKP